MKDNTKKSIKLKKSKTKKKSNEVNSELFKRPVSNNFYEDMAYEDNENKKLKISRKMSKGRADSFLIFLIFALITIGLVMILSSSYYRAIDIYQNGTYFFTRQLIWAVFSFIVMFIVMNIDYKFIKKFIMLGYYGSIALLLLVFVFGVANKGATRWFEIGSFSFQPSEIAKIMLIMALAKFLAKRKTPTCKEDTSFKSYYKEFAIVLIPALLIFIENLSTGIVVAATGMLMIAISGFKLERLFIYVGIPAIIIGIMFIKLGGIDLISGVAGGKYKARLERFEVWLDPWEDPTGAGFQVVQSLYAIGSGGIFGVGLGKSKQKLGYIPEAHNDIIFAIICEEFGLIGAIFLLTLFMMLIIRCIKIAYHAPDKFSMYFVAGMITLIALQVIVNVGVVTNSMPATGMPLPFISYGGTSLTITMAGMGMILNISKYVNLNGKNNSQNQIEQDE